MFNQFRQPVSIHQVAERYPDPPAAALGARQLAEQRLIIPALSSTQSNTFLQLAKPHTLTVWLHLTERCTLRCLYCYLPPTGRSMSAETGRRAVEAAFHTAAQAGFEKVKLKYAGGEPTLHFERLVEISQAAEAHSAATGIGLESVMLSNGLAISDRMIGYLSEHGIQLMISLDGIGAYQNSQRQRPGGRPSFNLVLRTLDRLDAHKLRPQISVTVSRKNLPGLPELVRFLLERDYPFHLNFFRENPYAREADSTSLPPEELVAGLRLAFSEVEQNLPARSLLGALLDRVRLDVPHDRPCGACQSYLVVRTDGAVTPCQMIDQAQASLDTPELLKEITSRSDAQLLNPPSYQREPCAGCFWQFACAGGCPLLARQSRGSENAASPYCMVYQTLIPDVLRLEGLRLLRELQNTV